MSAAAPLIVQRNRKLGVRYDVAESCGQLEWLASILDEKQFLAELLRELACEPTPANASDAELVGRLRAALDLLHSDTVDVASVAAVIGGAIRALGGRA